MVNDGGAVSTVIWNVACEIDYSGFVNDDIEREAYNATEAIAEMLRAQRDADQGGGTKSGSDDETILSAGARPEREPHVATPSLRGRPGRNRGLGRGVARLHGRSASRPRRSLSEPALSVDPHAFVVPSDDPRGTRGVAARRLSTEWSIRRGRGRPPRFHRRKYHLESGPTSQAPSPASSAPFLA